MENKRKADPCTDLVIITLSKKGQPASLPGIQNYTASLDIVGSHAESLPELVETQS